MGTYDVGSKFERVPVLKFIGYSEVVVLFNGRPEVASIEGETNVFKSIEDIYHISAPAGTVADVEIRPIIIRNNSYDYLRRGCTDDELKKLEKIRLEKYAKYGHRINEDKELIEKEHIFVESMTGKDLIASNIRVERSDV